MYKNTSSIIPSLNVLLLNPSSLQDFYISNKSKFLCDKSLDLLEDEIFSSFYEEYFARHESDYLLNTKIDLYKERLLPRHLNIQERSNNLNNVIDDVDNNVEIFKSIKFCKSPSQILNKYLDFIIRNNKEVQDDLLNILVYTIIKSNIKDLRVLVKYMRDYRRRIFINCGHRIKRNESEYYIKILEIALEFIEKMEYKDLNISKEEYEELIGI
ncbi:vacuolar protein sorting-associated protein 9A-like protein [Vairimorpha necatrix]|uniref:Vacuolar protein sorting-associated protein 9A-like protein n=1 Tax=Vairimorpha necatrix TaxID=6039 RepID=A0AAX4JB92_9MICR